jgi:hypothetical protein
MITPICGSALHYPAIDDNAAKRRDESLFTPFCKSKVVDFAFTLLSAGYFIDAFKDKLPGLGCRNLTILSIGGVSLF